jgi:hypothetical protein
VDSIGGEIGAAGVRGITEAIFVYQVCGNRKLVKT